MTAPHNLSNIVIFSFLQTCEYYKTLQIIAKLEKEKHINQSGMMQVHSIKPFFLLEVSDQLFVLVTYQPCRPELAIHLA